MTTAGYICTHCRRAYEMLLRHVRCPHCGAPIPDDVHQAIDASRPPRPQIPTRLRDVMVTKDAQVVEGSRAVNPNLDLAPAAIPGTSSFRSLGSFNDETEPGAATSGDDTTGGATDAGSESTAPDPAEP